MNPSPLTLPERQPIRRLPEEVINQIAAGEVIERPSSVLKELVENSLDAGASQVDVYLKNGGIDEVSVADDGTGIELAEWGLAVERHATSKLQRPEDLFSLTTLGFRGEALSSICSVAEVELVSRTHQAESAYSVCFKMGKAIGPPNFLGAPLGTRMTVSHLFGHTPARRKFLRSQQTELAHCQTLLKEIALGHPEVRFSLHHNDKTLVTYTSHTKRDRFLECLKLNTELVEIDSSHEHMRLQAFFTLPHVQIARAELYLFINGRPVRNRNFLSAIRNVYKEMNPNIEEPVGACFLEIRKDWVDVNVHPQKWEVRCLEQAAIYHWILSSLRKCFSSPNTPTPVSPVVGLAASSSHVSHSPSSQFLGNSNLQGVSLVFIGRTTQALICAEDKGIIVADIKRLTSRLLARQLSKEWHSNPERSIRLPVPCILRFSEVEAQVIEKYQPAFEQWGFEIEYYGEGDYSLESRPTFMPAAATSLVFRRLLSEFSDSLRAHHFLSNPYELLLFLISLIQEVSNDFDTFSNSELLLELEQWRKHPEKSSHFFIEVPYEQLTPPEKP